MPWISNHKHKIEVKSTKSSRSSSKVVGLGLADLWEFPTLVLCPHMASPRANELIWWGLDEMMAISETQFELYFMVQPQNLCI